MIASACIIVLQKIAFGYWSASTSLLVVTFGCLSATLLIGFLTKPTDKEILCRFYSSIRPFGVWGPIRRLAEQRGLVPRRDRMPIIDAVNGLLTAGFQLSLALVPFYCFLRFWDHAARWAIAAGILGVILYFSWYKNLPSLNED
jgi:hypothetical protein